MPLINVSGNIPDHFLIIYLHELNTSPWTFIIHAAIDLVYADSLHGALQSEFGL